MEEIYGGIETGGTKVVCVLAKGKDILEKHVFPTTTPDETIRKIVGFFSNTRSKPKGVGISSFGPLDINPSSPTFGHITSTPKPGWANTDLVTPLEKALGVPVFIDTDVNGAALGEFVWGSAQELDTFIYLTIGTGIGGGGMVNGKLMHGLMHPEMGHIRIPHDKEKDPFEGVCPFHGDCFEGLASGPAMKERWGVPAEKLSKDHPAWALEAEYISYALVNYITTLSPEKIILGGGVMHQPGLIAPIQNKVKDLMNDYILHPLLQGKIEEFIVPPELGDDVGVLGAVALAMQGRY